jgi:selenocysteine-specific elongation factor
MKRVVIGTAGHVDHGKTSLVKAITGVDCDRLKEEKERGLTIELGFTSMTLPSGARVGVVDVPGHVRFIRHMLSGASGIDLVLLVVAADEGVMPQTKEHVQICSLLGIERGVVALTKKDLVDADLLALAVTDVREFLSSTFLKDAPVIPVSSVTREGLDALMRAVGEQVGLVRERSTEGIAALPVDRVFTVRGFGTVVTGTLSRGTLAPGMEVDILPPGRRARIRNIQVHEADVERAQAGLRTAVNLQGVSTDEVSRGQWVAPAGVYEPTRTIDARVELVNRPPRGAVLVHIGACEVQGRLSLHEAGGSVFARIRLSGHVVASYGDRFILRAPGGSFTIGGAVVLNPHPRRRVSVEVMEGLASGDMARRVDALARDAGLRGITRRAVEAVFACGPGAALKAVDALMSAGSLVRFDASAEAFVHRAHLERLKEALLQQVGLFHEANPAAPGMPREHLRGAAAPGADAKLFHRALSDLLRKGALAESGPVIARAGFRPALAAKGTDLGEKMALIIDTSGFEPPSARELAQALGVGPGEVLEVLNFLCRQGRIVKIRDDMHISRRVEDELKERVRSFITEHGAMTPADVKAAFGVSRKFAIPYLEYLDRIHFTMRVGDSRRLSTPGRR